MMKRLLCIGLLALACTQDVQAQGCAVCTKTASSLDDKGARGLNGGILYLALLPLALMGTVGFIWWRSDRGTSVG
jgi:hypothetical protein